MPAAALGDDETERLSALIALNIVGSERSADFDIFPRLAGRIFGAPMAAVSLVEQHRQWFKASVGLDACETPLEMSFCSHAILQPDRVLYVPDATKDPRFADNEAVTGECGVRFYAGAPIIGPTGHALGALCVMDRAVREVEPEALEQLQFLAIGVGNALKLHASVQELQNKSCTDSLTGLQNRAGFMQRLEQSLAYRQGAPGSRVGLLFLDLDGFKSINDLFGHGWGDEALREVGRRLSHATRARDTVTRFGGDEFCILVDGIGEIGGLHSLAGRIHATLSQPFSIEGQAVPLRTSIGVAVYPDHASRGDDLIRKADSALYDAKRAGRGTTSFAVSSGAGGVQLGRNEIRELLREACLSPGKEPFTLALQPIFATDSGTLTGFEALVRWVGPDGRTRQPSEFIPAAEATGLIVHIDRFVLSEACALAAKWPEHLEISSNVSAVNFFAGDLVREVRSVLARHNLAPWRLTLEITETVLLRDPERVQRIISDLRDLGVQVTLDDFGAGHASLAYLRDYRFNGLKIDRSFTAALETDPRSRAFVRAILDMARALGVEANAEGVETPGQLAFLRKRRVDFVQGYLLGRPMTPEAASDLIRGRLVRAA